MFGNTTAIALLTAGLAAPLAGVTPAAWEPAAHPTALDAVALTGETYLMGGTFVPTPDAGTLGEMDDGFLAWAADRWGEVLAPATALTTPETIFPDTYLAGEQILADKVAAAEDGSTFLGISQSAGIIGMLLGMHPEVLHSGDHFVAFAPPTMPGAGLFSAAMDPNGFWGWLYGLDDSVRDFPTVFDLPDGVDGVTVDVYCGLYDPYCNTLPANFDNLGNYLLAWLNSQAAGFVVHTGYPAITDGQLDAAVHITGPDYDPDPNLDPDSTGVANFWMLPNSDPTVLPLFSWMTLFSHDLAVYFSDMFRPAIDSVYVDSALYAAMMQVEATMDLGL